MSAPTIRLVGDIGGTNARFALARDGVYTQMQTLVGGDYPTFEQAIEAYLATLKDSDRPTEAAFAIAGPVSGERVAFTNHSWSFGKTELKQHFKLDRLIVLNDFGANAVAIPYLDPADLTPIGPGARVDGAACGILGPGTGLGISGLVQGQDGAWIALEGEGGHATMPPHDAREGAVLDLLRRRYNHVSIERVLSGDGLVNLYNALCELDGVPSLGYKPPQVSDAELGRTDRQCREAVEMFCAMLGGVAGNLALTLGARGGIFIAGGIVPRLGDRFFQSEFRARFEAKGRFQSYLAGIPTLLMTHKNPALVGLSRLP